MMRRLASIAMVVVGLLALSQAASMLQTLISFAYSEAPDLNLPLAIGLSLLPLVTSLALGVFLIAMRHRLAARWFEDEPLAVSSAPDALLRGALMVLGVWMIIVASPWLIASVLSIAARYFTLRGVVDNVEPRQFLAYDLPGLVARAIGVLLGVFLVRRAAWLSERLVPTAAVAATLARCPHCGSPYDPHEYRAGVVSRCIECDEPLDPAGSA